MPESDWNRLTEQLHDAEPKARCRAIRQLAATRDPQVIPLLRNAYLQDEDDRVHAAAERALAQFRAIQQGRGLTRRLSIGQVALSRAIGVLAVILVALLAANVAVRALDRGGSDGSASEGDVEAPLERSVFERDLRTRLMQIRSEVERLRESDRVYRETGGLACDKTGSPASALSALSFSALTRQTYQADLTPIADRLDATLPFLQSAQARWAAMCAAGTANMTDLVRASAELDQVTVDLNLAERDLSAAIANPAPAPPGGLSAQPATAFPTGTPSPTATIPPTNTPTPTATRVAGLLPLPDLDYPALLRELNARLAVLGDLQRPYKNGILDNWRQSEQGAIISSLSCALDPWPAAFEWTAEQRAQLDRPDAADPEIETAARLINEGLALAVEARALYEPSCASQTLAETAAQGLALGTQAQQALLEAQALVDRIRRRSSQ